MALPDPIPTHLFADDPAGLAQLRRLPPSTRVTSCDSPQGPIACIDERKLHSARDPVKEARRFARDLDLAQTTVVVLIGYGSGYVARAIAERSEATIYAFEPDLEVLREGLSHGEIPQTLRIITTPTRMAQVLYAQLQAQDRGLIVRWAASIRCDPPAYEEGLARAIEAVDRANLRHRTFRMRGKGWLKHYLANFSHLQDNPGLPVLKGGMKGVPAIIVAAGPSLDKNVRMLGELGDGALIITVNTAAGALARAGVRPHALASIESLDITPMLENLPFLREIPAFLELTGNPALWQLPFAKKLPISVDTSLCATFSGRLDPHHRLSAGFCVANTATAIAYLMGCNPIILVGSDLAYTGDKVYAAGTLFEDMRVRDNAGDRVSFDGLAAKHLIDARSKDATSGNLTPESTTTSHARAWDGESTVRTARDFLMFRDWYAYAGETMRAEGIETINATEGGAFIPGWTHRRLADVIEAHGLKTDRGVRRQFDTLLQRQGHSARQLHDVLTAELERVRALLKFANEAQALVGHDPDGDLRLGPSEALHLTDINARVRSLLSASPLASEASAGPIEAVRARSDITTYSFYEALREPVAELAGDLARLLQRLEPEVRRAS